jgi:two-component sensor histidine kinase
VLRNGAISYRLTAFVRAAAFGEVLNSQGLPSGWTAGVLDGEHQLIGYSPATSNLDDAIGERASQSVIERIRNSKNSPIFLGNLLDRPMYFAVRQSALSGWTTFVGAPAEVIEAPLRRHRAIMLGAGAVAVLLTLLLAGTLLRSAARLREEKAIVHQKDLLLREINHRIKNNLQVISSLVNLQADRAPLPQTRRELETIGSRVRALSLVHEQLHPRLAEGVIDLATYLDQLCGNLLAVHGWAARNVRLVRRLQPVTVKADAAVPIGLIVNEALTNSLKHAFPHGRGGRIQITLEGDGPSRARLEFTDDGVGLSPEVTRDEGVGLSLIEMLVDQTGGELCWGRNDGTSLRLNFPF